MQMQYHGYIPNKLSQGDNSFWIACVQILELNKVHVHIILLN